MVSGLLQTHVGDQYIPLVAVTMFADRQQLGIAALAIVYARWRPRPWHQLQQQLGIAAAARLARHCNILSPGRCGFCAPAEWRARPTVPQLLRCVPWHAEAVQSWEMGWAMGATKGIQHVKHPAWGPGPAYSLLLNQQRSTGDIHHDVWWLSEVRAMSTVVMVPLTYMVAPAPAEGQPCRSAAVSAAMCCPSVLLCVAMQGHVWWWQPGVGHPCHCTPPVWPQHLKRGRGASALFVLWLLHVASGSCCSTICKIGSWVGGGCAQHAPIWLRALLLGRGRTGCLSGFGGGPDGCCSACLGITASSRPADRRFSMLQQGNPLGKHLASYMHASLTQ